MLNVLSAVQTHQQTDPENPNDYPVYPEEDGSDRPRNPYSPV